MRYYVMIYKRLCAVQRANSEVYGLRRVSNRVCLKVIVRINTRNRGRSARTATRRVQTTSTACRIDATSVANNLVTIALVRRALR
jgi:hypothetical protein